MRILVTGAGGNLGRVVIPALAKAGHELRLFDFRAVPSEHEVIVGDVRDADAVARAMRGVDAVVHGAALHGIHLGDWSVDDFWSTNCTGTFVVYDAAREAGVRRIVLASSMAVYGVGADSEGGWTTVTEDTPCRPADAYGMTKVVAEDIARFHADAHDITTVSLRLGMFVPETFDRYGFRLLFGGVDDRDVAAAVALALAHEPAEGFAAFDIMADSAVSADDLNADLPGTLDRHWPGITSLVGERGLDLDALVWGRVLYPVDKARNELGYAPQHDFSTFLEAWRRGDSAYYPYADEPWWGTERPSI